MNEQKWCENVDPANGRKCIRPLGHSGPCGGDGIPTHDRELRDRMYPQQADKPQEVVHVGTHPRVGT